MKGVNENVDVNEGCKQKWCKNEGQLSKFIQDTGTGNKMLGVESNMSTDVLWPLCWAQS